MRREFRFASLRPDSEARLPAMLVLLLVASLVMQVAIPSDEPLPPAGAVGRVRETVVAPPPAVTVPPALTARAMFAPGAAQGGGAGAPADPLDGVTVAGSIRVGRLAVAIVAYRGRTVRLPLGGRIAGWRLQALGATGATFVRGAERVTRGFGAAAPTPPAADSSEETQ